MRNAPPRVSPPGDRSDPRRQILPARSGARRHSWALVLIGFLTGFSPAEEFEFFETKIRPVLVEHCYPCHSAQSEQLRGGLRLDSREGMRRGGESGQPAIVPGDVATSRLIAAIRIEHEDLQMPPPQRARLRPEQVADFVAWVKQGAPDPRVGPESSPSLAPPKALPSATNHWAFRRPQSMPLPAVQDRAWPATPIDFFILAKLEENGLAPSPPADRRTWIRRATFDLTGLPPSIAELEEFARDHSPEAFARVVDRLLASPQYGERWGRHWLDVARFADTKGYVYGDREEARFVHSATYRDWVIQAFNDDLPYDRFLLLQIAADQAMRPNESEDLAAMGFLTLGRRFLGVIHDIIDDRIDVLMRGTQALTMGCARCHDHKFDPISTREYYSLYGVFAGATEKIVSLPEPRLRPSARLEFEAGWKERGAKYEQTIQKKREEFTNRFRSRTADYLTAVLDVKKLPTEEHYEIRGPNDLNPKIVRNWESFLRQAKGRPHPVFGPWHDLESAPPSDFAARSVALLREWTSAHRAPVRINPAVLNALSAAPLTSMRDVASRYGELLAGVHEEWQGLLQKALHQKTQAPEALTDPDREQLRLVLYGPNSPVHIPALAAADIEWYFDEPSRVELMKLNSEMERWIIRSTGAPPHAVILEDRANLKRPRVFLRGNPANQGEEVPRQFLEVLAGPNRKPFEKGSGRLELARAIASPDNPLTARVMVNRVWQRHFGAGLVRTPSDFGIRSEPPSHPELLDWLARQFVNDGWSLKKLHRLILLSRTYQQASSAPPAVSMATPAADGTEEAPNSTAHAVPAARAATLDPENRLLWRMNRSRLDLEMWHDALLVASGELDRTMRGAPGDLFKPPFSPRRAVYGLIDRQFLPGVFRVFDFANPDMHNPQRPETTVPQQALFFMNHPFVVERARALLKRVEVSAFSDPGRRIDLLHRIVYQRPATPGQVALGLEFVAAAQSEIPTAPPVPPPSVWRYGFGSFDGDTQRVKQFVPLSHFTGEAWQGGGNWPDPKLGWVRLTAAGGHAGNDLEHAAIRRWVAPMNAAISIAGLLKHDHAAGDGVRARLISSRQGLLGDWKVHQNQTETRFDSVRVQKDDTLDFLVDFNANLNSDDFTWVPTLKIVEPDVAAGSAVREWNSKKEFGGPPPTPPEPLNAWEKYAQVLLLANEFMFVD